MIINGPTTTRDDGSTVCIGYGIDSDGQVTGRFALPKGTEWDAPATTETIKYVNSIDNLPTVNSDYRGPV